jgi:hypothetical protein
MKQLIFAILFASLAFNAKAQDTYYRKWKFSIMSEAISMPSYKVLKNPVHPGYRVGVNLKTKTFCQHSHVFEINFGYYSHSLIGNSRLFWYEFINRNLFHEIDSIQVPVYFLQGAFDYQTPTSLAEAFFDQLKAPRKEFFTFSN